MDESLLTPEQARKVLLKNQENLVKKASEGKVLSSSEQELLLKIATRDDEAPKPTLTAQQLANELGISRRTVFYLRKNDNAPETCNLEEWRQYLEERAAENVDGLHDDFLPEQLQKTRHQLLRAQAGKEEAIRRLKEIELEKEQKGLVPMSDAKNAIRAILGPLKAILEAYPKANAQAANPADPLMAEEAMEEGLFKAFQMIQKEIEK